MTRKKMYTQTTLSDAAPQTSCKFMSLPAELRNHIYELAFDGTTCSIANHKRNMKYNYPPGILVSCKVIYAEARQIYYNTCDFTVYKIGALHRWLHTIGYACRKSLKRLAYDPAFKEMMWLSYVTPEQVLCRVDHMLQAKDVAIEVGGVRVWTKEKWWYWELDEDGKKQVVEWRAQGGGQAKE
ncbi:hypothetical protein PRZ48_014693 [Zasmidium cellare]|uniref:Uncharacterized protein n=1 Tax=Zasmidium cellare TaxID=395010 RepID=A0ABR0DZF9_ZASCE|nr:hypothetical protein PRZ48_014693 [Zasmidium cellare]